MTKTEMLQSLRDSDAKFVTYGEDGVVVSIEDAIDDIDSMDDDDTDNWDYDEVDCTHERVIFDNGGGITVQLHGWAHYYNDEAQAADDVAVWLKTHDTSDWGGHEDAALFCDPGYEQTRNGGYRTWTIHAGPYDNEYDGEFPLSGWGNIDVFFDELQKALK